MAEQGGKIPLRVGIVARPGSECMKSNKLAKCMCRAGAFLHSILGAIILCIPCYTAHGTTCASCTHHTSAGYEALELPDVPTLNCEGLGLESSLHRSALKSMLQLQALSS